MILLGMVLKGARVLRQRYPHGGHDQGQTSSGLVQLGPTWSTLSAVLTTDAMQILLIQNISE